MKTARFLVVALTMALSCSMGTDDLAGGGGTEAGNARVACSVMLPDGSPATGAAASLRTADYLYDSAFSPAGYGADDVVDGVGICRFDSIPSGAYFLSINYADSLSSIQAVHIALDGSAEYNDSMTLRASSSLRGVVDARSLRPGMNAVALLQGLDARAPIDTTGLFVFEHVPAMDSVRVVVAVHLGSDIDTLSAVASVDAAPSVLPDTVRLTIGYAADTLVVRAILDSNGLAGIPAVSVTSAWPDSTGVRALRIMGRGVSLIPDQIADLLQLDTLNLSWNPLGSIPASVGALTAIRELVLDSVGLTEFPGAILGCRSLANLSLDYNSISTIPDSITRLTSLTNLSMDFAGLLSVNEAVFSLPQLKVLSCGGNGIDSLPEAIHNAVLMHHLNFYNNDLTGLPAGFCEVRTLREVNLSGNLLAALPDSIGNLTQLMTLKVPDNRLTGLPESITLLRVSELQIQGNAICAVSDSVRAWLDKWEPGWDTTQACGVPAN